MKTKKEIWPEGKPTGKDEIERMYRLSYCVDPAFFRKEDVVDLGLDFYRLKEFGEVRMSKSLQVLRKRVPYLWDRMTGDQKAAYVMSDVMSGLQYVDSAVKELEKCVGSLPEAHDGVLMARDGIETVKNGIFARMPAGLRGNLDKGFGKWRQTK